MKQKKQIHDNPNEKGTNRIDRNLWKTSRSDSFEAWRQENLRLEYIPIYILGLIYIIVVIKMI